MSHEPRMRGTRFRQIARKKQGLRESRADRHQTGYYEREETDLKTVASNILNAIDHLGNQRFGLPPFTEHFQRWSKDVNTLITEFETQFPNAADQQFHTAIESARPALTQAFSNREELEAKEMKEIAHLQQQLARCELQLSKIDQENNKQTSELRKQYGRSSDKLHAEIVSLDKERLNILQKRAGILQRIFRRPEAKLEQSNTLIQSKKAQLREDETKLEQSLTVQREQHFSNQKELLEEHENIKSKLAGIKENSIDDALEIRAEICKRIHQAIVDAIQRTDKQQTTTT
ncbi:MAG TPA: hypothetical protein VEH56_03935 [Candidatus Saccharimonadales bacterium]|nr:hypothetical protein [Candidatus Saccharimonadales bacterium]